MIQATAVFNTHGTHYAEDQMLQKIKYEYQKSLFKPLVRSFRYQEDQNLWLPAKMGGMM